MSKGSRTGRNRENARQRIARQRAEEARRRKRRLWAAIGGGVVVVIAAAVGITLAVTGGSSPPTATTEPLSALGALQPAPAAGPVGPEGVPIPSGAALAGPGTAASGQPIDGISCSPGERCSTSTRT